MSSPTKVLNSGKISIAQFENDYKGKIIPSYKFQKSYKNAEDKWVNTDFVNCADLMDVLVLCHRVLETRIKEKGGANENSEAPI